MISAGQKKQEAAVRFAQNVLDDQDKADALADLSLEEYAERRGLEIIDNPGRRVRAMANGTGGSMTKEERCGIVCRSWRPKIPI